MVALAERQRPGEQPFPHPRFPGGVAVPPAALLAVLLGAAVCLVAWAVLTGSAGGGRWLPVGVAGLAVGTAGLCGFVALWGVLVRPVRQLRADLVAMVCSGQPQGYAAGRSAVREVDRISVAVGAYRGAVPHGRRGPRVPLTVAVVLVAATLLGALVAGYVLGVAPYPASLVAGAGAHGMLLITGEAGGAVLLVLGHVQLNMVRPLRQLVAQAEAIAAVRHGGRAPEPIAPRRLDEIGAVAAGLNELLTQATAGHGTAAVPVGRGDRAAVAAGERG